MTGTDAMRRRDNAIQAQQLRKTYPGAVRALDGLSFEVEGGHDLRPARPERGGQVDDREDPDHALARRQRRGTGGRPRRRSRRPAGAPPYRRSKSHGSSSTA
jgi:hypothetical protein